MRGNILHSSLSLALLLLLTLPAVVQAQFTFTTNADNTLTITGYTGPGGVVVIPAITNGYPVTSIGTSAFQWKSKVDSVTVPNGVTAIGTNAFYGCTGLTNANITSVAIIMDGALRGCHKLPSLLIPSSTTNIGYCVFYDDWALNSITVESNSPTYCSVDAILFNKNKTTLIQCPEMKGGTYAIPTTVSNIADYAFFACHNLASVAIPNSVIRV
jgi:hypothetical protein